MSVRIACLLAFFLVTPALLIAQGNSQSPKKIVVKKRATTAPITQKEDYSPTLRHVEMPFPGQSKARLAELKKEVEKRFPRTYGSSDKQQNETNNT